MHSVTVSGLDEATKHSFHNQPRQVDEFPNECPICHRTIIAEPFSQGFTFGNWLELYFRCANHKCARAFIALYDLDRGRSNAGAIPYFILKSTAPVVPINKLIPPEIANLSPSFVTIIGQAEAAEDHGLDEIAGPGFRKALEFLIKDYAISLATTPEDVDNIKKQALQSVITNYLSGEKLPIVSSRATWLGNDETHYERRWVGKDLSDLKNLIAAVEHFISMEKLVATLPASMPDPKVTLKT